MTRYILASEFQTVTDVFSRDRPPIISIRSGDQLQVRTLDSAGSLRKHVFPGEKVPTMIPGRRGHCLVGPIEVKDAQVGTVLAVKFKSLVPENWGWTAAAVLDNPLNQRMTVLDDGPRWLLWSIDVEKNIATNQFGISRCIAPFLGVVGLPPATAGEHSTIPPRTEGGGNIDCRELVAGSTLFIPVTVPGAMLCLGDGHAAQGDGEVSGTAIECAMTSEIVVEVVQEPSCQGVYAETPNGRITFGFDSNLNVAMGDALSNMVSWMQKIFDLDRGTALALGSSLVDLRVTQVANQSFGVHALLREDLLR